MTETRLDAAHAAMEATPGDDRARLAFFDRLAESELFLLLEAEVTGGAQIVPRLFPVEDGPVVVAFDSEDRLADFAGGPAPYAALSGRGLAAQLAGQGIGLGLNLGASSETLLPAEAMDWLAAILAERPRQVEARPRDMTTPRDLPDRLLDALDAKLAAAAGLADLAWLAAVTWDDGSRGHLLAFVETRHGAEAALAQAVAEALAFSGLDAAALDVAFFAATDPFVDRLSRVGVRIDLPVPETPRVPGQAPGMDPERPPRLR